MTTNPTAGVVALSLLLACTSAEGGSAPYPWLAERQAARTLSSAIAPPLEFDRAEPVPGSFAAWLAALPLRPEGSPVSLFTGTEKFRQDVHAAVVDIDVGGKNLQQCADAVIRLRAEWLRAAGRGGEIGFDYTGGGRVAWTRWARGERPTSDGKRWSRKAKADDSYAAFRRYLEQVFAYAGTYSLERELMPVPIGAMQVGDVFVKGGFPGHAVLVADMARNTKTGEKRFLLLQSFMPAQDIHVLKNPRDPAGSPWYPLELTGDLVTPEWTFSRDSLRRWP
ncbi:MAG: hypothetical protein KJZ80_14720 [Hyphomicrobiaceae bacterium]|nr:hypothetical protein [Hyphomicrobiaceae bacterium]